MAAALAPTEQIPGRKLVAPVWHTFVFLTFLAGYSLIEIGRVARLESRNSSSRLPQYLLMICFELTLVGYVWFLGLRPTGTTISDLIGGKWGRWTDALKDVGVAFLFWLVVISVLVGERLVLGRDSLSLRATMVLAPHGAVEIIAWCFVAVAAGVCEEIVFRGYLQRQFLALTGRPWIAVILQALVFGLGHSYKGLHGVFTIALYGALFGILATRRKSLRPGMMQHTAQDFVAGLSASFLSKGA